ncbi:hypothetical protein ACVWWD_000535 [Mesorhizobium sp. URHB0026]
MAFGRLVVDVVEGQHVGGHLRHPEGRHADPQERHLGGGDCLAELIGAALVFLDPVFGAGLFAHVADLHLLAVVRTQHDDHHGGFFGVDQRFDLFGPVVEIIAHEA